MFAVCSSFGRHWFHSKLLQYHERTFDSAATRRFLPASGLDFIIISHHFYFSHMRSGLHYYPYKVVQVLSWLCTSFRSDQLAFHWAFWLSLSAFLLVSASLMATSIMLISWTGQITMISTNKVPSYLLQMLIDYRVRSDRLLQHLAIWKMPSARSPRIRNPNGM